MPDKEFSFMYRLVFGFDNFPAIEAQLKRLGVRAQYIDKGIQRFYRVPVEDLPKLDRGYGLPLRLPVDDQGRGYIFQMINDNDPVLSERGRWGKGWTDVTEQEDS